MPARTWKAALAATTAVAASGLTATAALATPTASTPPAISGKATYGSTLTCNNGSWSAGAGSFTYAWQLADGNVQIGTNPTLRIQAKWVGLGIVCVVSAKDASGAGSATSPPVSAAPVTPTITITRARQTVAATVEVEGKVSPTASLAGGTGSLILYRQTKAGLQQLSFTGNQTRPAKDGTFRLVAGDQPVGRSAYVVQYVPSADGYTAQALATRRIRVSS